MMLEIILGFDSRKAKEARRNPSCPVSDLFRLNGRTIIGECGKAIANAIIENGADVVGIDLMADERSLWEMNQNLMAGVGQYQALDEVYCSSISEPVEATAEKFGIFQV